MSQPPVLLADVMDINDRLRRGSALSKPAYHTMSGTPTNSGEKLLAITDDLTRLEPVFSRQVLSAGCLYSSGPAN